MQPNAVHYVIFAYVIVSEWTQTPQALYNGDVGICICAIAPREGCKVVLVIAVAVGDRDSLIVNKF
jgi:hypothetical protein